MMRFIFTLVFGIVFGIVFTSFALPLRAQEIVTDISQYEIELRHSFTGETLLLFGAINSDDVESARYEIVIAITGEARNHLVRKKERVFGFWVNTEAKLLENVPVYYALASTRPLSEIADAEVLANLKLGIENQDFTATAVPVDYIEGLIRNKEDERLFAISTEEMPVISGVLFRADFFFPATVPSGSYTASAYLFKDGVLLGRTDKVIRIDKAGFERAVYTLATEQPRLYGIMAVIIALFAGWLAGFVTRRKSRLG